MESLGNFFEYIKCEALHCIVGLLAGRNVHAMNTAVFYSIVYSEGTIYSGIHSVHAQNSDTQIKR